MRAFRKVLFWVHLTTGVAAGVVVLIMSVTGVLLTYEKQMLAWSELRDYRAEPPAPGAPRLSMDVLAERVLGERRGTPSSITVRSDPADPIAFGFGRKKTVYANPYTGEVLGEGSSGLSAFFREVVAWHRWLGASGEGRATGRAITGACNLAFLFLVVSGAYLWWPRHWKWRNVKAVTLFQIDLRGKARDFNWHNVFGFWCAVPLFVLVLSGVVISYPWAGDLVYRVAGEDPPAARRGGRSSSGPAQNGGHGDSGLSGLEGHFQKAARHVRDWRTITLRLPGSGHEPLAFSIDQGTGGQPHLRSTLFLDRQTADVVRWETFSDGSPGRRLRSVLRFAHTGEAAGIAGQTVAGIASFGAAFLVWTGLALSWRRFCAWRRRRSSA